MSVLPSFKTRITRSQAREQRQERENLTQRTDNARRRRLSFEERPQEAELEEVTERSLSESDLDLSYEDCNPVSSKANSEEFLNLEEANRLLEETLERSAFQDAFDLRSNNSNESLEEAHVLLEETLQRSLQEDEINLSSDTEKVWSNNIDSPSFSELGISSSPIIPIIPYPQPVLRIRRLNMSLTITQVIDVIPTYSGESEQLSQFVTTIQTLYENVAQTDRTLFLVVVKSKLKGRAFEVINEGSYSTWNEIKEALKTELQPKIDLQTANQNLFRIKQFPNESVKEFGERIRKAKKQLDDATTREVAADLRDQMRILNSGLAKQAFEANLSHHALRTIVIAADKPTLRESIENAITQEQKFFSQTQQVNQFSQKNSNSYQSNNNNNNNNRRENPINSNMRPQVNRNFFPRNNSWNKPQYCYTCGKPGHFSPDCPEKNRQRPTNSGNFSRPFQGRYQKISYNNVPEHAQNQVQVEQNRSSEAGKSKNQTFSQGKIRNMFVGPSEEEESLIREFDPQEETHSEN